MTSLLSERPGDPSLRLRMTGQRVLSSLTASALFVSRAGI
jgi:hypothetical protein